MRILVKIGGSLFSNLKKLDHLFKKLDELKVETIILTGGGIFADTVREAYLRYGLTGKEAHDMAVKAMEIFSILTACKLKKGVLCDTISDAESYLLDNKIPVLLPFKIISKINILPESWYITSDSIAVFLGYLLKADIVVLAKAVDGIYLKGELVKKINANRVKGLGGYVDNYVLDLVRKYKVKVAVMNGFKPEMLDHIVKLKPNTYTLITS